MAVDLSGTWTVRTNNGIESTITLPGTLNGAGLGDPASRDTEWISGLHNPFWYEREEYKSGDTEDLHAPFLAQTRTLYAGKAQYSRSFETEREGEYYFFAEISKWRLTLFADGEEKGSDESLCAPFCIGPFYLSAGRHEIKLIIDNSMLHPYRPDSHGISDALNACWNGMAGRIALIGADERQAECAARRAYAAAHARSVKVCGRNITIDGKAQYMRGTHFGGGFPATVYPPYERGYWDHIFAVIKEWGFNFIRFHSFCPPEAAFAAADEAGLFLQIECGMWNAFSPAGEEMYSILLRETRKILEAFGHHPSFVMLSPTNEPSGNWYEPLKKWVSDAHGINDSLGYAGRRIFTAQSGWYYDQAPADITGTDYVYFHRSAYGPIPGGMIRNSRGWRGKDYSPSLAGCRLPVISHEMGQWCSYPDLSAADKFTGPVRGGNYEIFRECARKNGVLGLNGEFTYCSGRNQVRLLKEEFEANFRTPEITGYEYLDLHDYTGQGTAVVGVLDPFFESKGYVSPDEFRQFNDEVVILARIAGYNYKNTDRLSARTEICNFSGADIAGAELTWRLVPGTGYDGAGTYSAAGAAGTAADIERHTYGTAACPVIRAGENTYVGDIEADLADITESRSLVLEAELIARDGSRIAANSWRITVFADTQDGRSDADTDGEECGAAGSGTSDTGGNIPQGEPITARTAEEAKKLLQEGRTVIFMPYMSDMDFECPPITLRNVFWNAQMGPSWSRPLGLVIDTDCPLFKYFPTSKSGGWEWENILDTARGLHFPAKYASIVRPVDDWNRNFPLSLIFEGRVFSGKLLFCSAELSGTFESRPEAYTLRKALFAYAASEAFDPAQELDWEDVTAHIRPLFKGADIIASVEPADGTASGNFIDLIDINPNIPFRYKPESLPVCFAIRLKRPVAVHRLYMLPIQSDRDFPGVIREYGIRAGMCEIRGEWKNGFETQWSDTIDAVTDTLEFTVYSTYSMGEAVRWYEGPDGFYSRRATEPLAITAASLGIEYDEAKSGGPDGIHDPEGHGGTDGKTTPPVRRSNEPFWRQEAARRHIEIDI